MKTIRRRYLALEVDSCEEVSSSEFMNAVWGAVTKLYGEVGASQAGLSLIDYDQQKKTAIIRVGHKALDMVRASLASITQLSNKPAAVHVLTVSGTIKALKKKARL